MNRLIDIASFLAVLAATVTVGYAYMTGTAWPVLAAAGYIGLCGWAFGNSPQECASHIYLTNKE